MAGHRKRARKHCGRKRSRGQKRAGSRRKDVPKGTTPVLTRAERRRKRYAEDLQCRAATLACNRAYYARHKDELRARQRKRYAHDSNYRHSVDASHWRSKLKHVYGITPEQYAAMLKRQKGRCAICRKKFRRRLGVDHCHCCRFVRGLLCTPCNMGLGYFKDRPHLLRRAAKYLERAAARARKEAKRQVRTSRVHDRS